MKPCGLTEKLPELTEGKLKPSKVRRFEPVTCPVLLKVRVPRKTLPLELRRDGCSEKIFQVPARSAVVNVVPVGSRCMKNMAVLEGAEGLALRDAGDEVLVGGHERLHVGERGDLAVRRLHEAASWPFETPSRCRRRSTRNGTGSLSAPPVTTPPELNVIEPNAVSLVPPGPCSPASALIRHVP